MATPGFGTVLQRLGRSVLRQDGAGLTDGQLLERFIGRRDEAAFEALLRRHGPMVLGVRRRVLHNEADAEDAFQATFLVLVRKAASVRPRGLVGNWLYGVAHNTARKARAMNQRRRAKERAARARPNPAAPAGAGPEAQELLEQELRVLPDKYRAVILLCDLEGRSLKDAARQLGCPVGTAGTRLARGRGMLARRLSRRGLTLSAGAVAAVLSPAAAAGMPPALVVATVKAASRLAAGQAAGGITSAQVAALTEGVIKAMLLSKLKIATVVLLALSAVVGLAIASRAGAGPGNEPTQPRQTARAASPQPPAKPAAKASRADQLKALRADYRKEYDELLQAVRAGKVKVKDGGVPEIAELRKRFAERARRLIDADPKDEVALEAILFSLHDLVADADDTKLYEVLTAHHLASPKLGSVVGRPNADEKFLRAVATKSPHAEARARAALALATLLARADRPREAEALLDKILQDKEAAKLSHHHGNLGKAAEDLRFEIRHLSPGKAAPELEGVDQDDKPLKLSDYRGKVVLLVFWATWCGPCMAMVPHERELVKRYAGRPFAVVGVNGDGDIAYPPGEKPIDNKAKVKAIMKREGITWRSFRDALKDPVTNRWQVPGISRKWNVDGWPTVFVIDHQGVIRHRFLGVPDKADLDAAVKKLVAAAGAKKQDSK